MAINIPRSPISQAATQRRSLLPASEAGQVARTFKYVADTALAVTTDYFDQKAKVDAENFSSNLKTFNEQQERSVQESARMIGMSEQEDPMGREAQLFDLGQTYIDNLKTFVDTEMEGMGPLAKKKLAPQMQKALTDLQKDPSGLMLDLTDSMEKGQFDAINARSKDGYSSFNLSDIPNQVVKDNSVLISMRERGVVSPEQIKNIELESANSIKTAYGLNGVSGVQQYFLDVMGNKFDALPQTMKDRMKADVVFNMDNYTTSIMQNVTQSKLGEFKLDPRTGGFGYKPVDMTEDTDKAIQVVDLLKRNNLNEEAQSIATAIITGRKNQASLDGFAMAAAHAENFALGASVDGPMLTPKQMTQMSNLIMEQDGMGVRVTDAAMLHRLDRLTPEGGLPAHVVKQLESRLEANDVEAFEVLSQFMGAANSFAYADPTNPDGMLSEKQLQRVLQYQILRKVGENTPIEALNSLNAPKPTSGKTGGTKTVTGDQVQKDELTLTTVTESFPDLTTTQQAYIFNKSRSLEHGENTFGDNPFLMDDEKLLASQELNVAEFGSRLDISENGNILIEGKIAPEDRGTGQGLRWVLPSVVRQIEEVNPVINGQEFNLYPDEEKQELLKNSILYKDPDANRYKIFVQEDTTSPGFLLNNGTPVYLELKYQNTAGYKLDQQITSFPIAMNYQGGFFIPERPLADMTPEEKRTAFAAALMGQYYEDFYFDPNNPLRATERALDAIVTEVPGLIDETLVSFEYMWNDAKAHVISFIAEGDKNEIYRKIKPPKPEELESQPGPPSVPLMISNETLKTEWDKKLRFHADRLSNPDFDYEVAPGVEIDPKIAASWQELKEGLAQVGAPGQQKFTHATLQKMGIYEDFNTVVTNLAAQEMATWIEQQLEENPSLANEWLNQDPSLISGTHQKYNTSGSLKAANDTVIINATNFDPRPQTIQDDVQDMLVEYGNASVVDDEDILKTHKELSERNEKESKGFLLDLVPKNLQETPYFRALEDELNHFYKWWEQSDETAKQAIEQSTGGPTQLAEEIASDSLNLVTEVGRGFGDMAASTIRVLAYDLWKQIIDQSPKGPLPTDENKPFYDSVGEILGGAGEGAWATVRTLFYDLPVDVGTAVAESQPGQEIKRGVEAMAESVPGQIVIDTSKGFIDLVSETFKVPYMIMEQWPKAKPAPERVRGGIKPLNPFPELKDRVMNSMRMNLEVRNQNGVEISVPGRAQLNSGSLRIVPDNPHHTQLFNGQNIDVKLSSITPIQDGLGSSIQFGTDALPMIPVENSFSPSGFEKNVEQWKKDNAEFNIMPRKDGEYYSPSYDMDIRNVQRFVSANENQAIHEISKMLYGSFDSEDKDFLFASGLIQKPKGARKGWYGKYYSKRSQEMLESFGQNPNSELKSMQTGLAQAMPGNSMVFVLGLTNQQFFSLVEDLYAQYESESK